MFCSSNSDSIKRTIDFFMKNGGIQEISLSGGEPLLHPVEEFKKVYKDT